MLSYILTYFGRQRESLSQLWVLRREYLEVFESAIDYFTDRAEVYRAGVDTAEVFGSVTTQQHYSPVVAKLSTAQIRLSPTVEVRVCYMFSTSRRKAFKLPRRRRDQNVELSCRQANALCLWAPGESGGGGGGDGSLSN